MSSTLDEECARKIGGHHYMQQRNNERESIVP